MGSRYAHGYEELRQQKKKQQGKELNIFGKLFLSFC